MIKKLKFILLSLLVLISAIGFSQVTTSSMSGYILDNNGEKLPGANVVAIHVPSGTEYGTVTNSEGQFNLQGMRPGGPYTVDISFIGYNKTSYTDIRLYLGETFALNVKLNETSINVDEIKVIGNASKFQTEKTGATVNITNEQMNTIPTINRSISNIAQLSPYSNGMSFAGGDGRSTNFTVDGANFNNNFGLSSSLPGGGNPISLDAIEEVQVVIAPFDVRQTNFIGGGINAITKSGTNKLKGTAYAYHRNEDMRGNHIGDVDFGERVKESKTTYGASVSGPIIKNKLFLFVNGEMEQRPQQVINWRPSDDGIANKTLLLSRTKSSDMEKVKQFLINNYGYNPGSYTDYPADESNKKLLARLDWNINNNNKLSLRYNYTKNQGWNPTNGNSTDAGFRNRSLDRISESSMAFSNSIYSMDNIVNSFSFDLNSKISDKLSNQLVSTYTKIADIRGSTSSPFPFIDIMNGVREDGTQILEPYMSAGYELFTWNNGVHNNIFNVIDNITYYSNNHKITGGVSIEHQMANNSYMRNGTGYYRYASVDDFLNQAAPRDFALTYGYDGEKNPAAEVAFNQYGIYGQDEWNLSKKFKLVYGLRADYLKYVDNIMTNNAILALDFNGKKIDTGNWPDAKVQYSPRVGFNWDINGDGSLKLRGGSGIFSGRLPLVFFTNMPTNSGMVQGSYTAVTTYNSNGSVKGVNPKLALLAGPMLTDVNAMITKLGLPNTISPEDGLLPSAVNAVDPKFKMPQVWKSSLALDYKLPTSFPLSVTVEGIYSSYINGVMLVDYNLKQPDETWTRFSGSDNRYIYPSNIKYTSKSAYVLTNNSDGWGAIGNITVKSEPIANLDLMISYTRTESKEISGMPGSAAQSAYNGLIEVDGPHLPKVQRSQYVVPNKFIGSASYKLSYLNNHMATTLSLFYSLMSTYGNSFTYSNDMNGDGFATDLIYIPNGKNDVKFKTSEDEDAFLSFIEQDDYLKKHKGEYAEAYMARSPMVGNLDLRFLQDFSVKVGKTTNTLQFSFDVLNFGNLINSEWSVAKTMSDSNYGQILKYEGKDINSVPTFSMVKVKDDSGVLNYPTNTYSTYYNYGQCWQMQIGLRYIF